MIPTSIYVFLFIQLSLVTYLDIKFKKISNMWSLLNILISIGLFISFSSIYTLSFSAFTYSILFIIIGFFLFQIKVMGGGDSKYLATFFLLVPDKEQNELFSYLLIATIIVGFIFLLKNTFKNRTKLIASLKEKNIEGVKSCFGTKFAYAPVILLAWIIFGAKNYQMI